MVYGQDHKIVIAKLAELFPKTFFEDSRQRVPLKHNIVADVEKQGCNDLIGYDVGKAIDFYISHVGYQMILTHAGRPRVDLNGKAVTKVTAQEARAAQQKVDEIHAGWNAQNPMSRVRNLGTDLMRKVDASPRLPSPDPRLELSATELVTSMEKKLTRITSLLESEDDEFKAEFLRKVVRELKADADAMLEQIK
jgi:sRNA-binding protein